jgi:hypothetical protein
VEVVHPSDRAEAQQAGTQVVVVARGDDTTAALPEPEDPGGVVGGEATAGVDGQQPELVVLEPVESAQGRVDLAGIAVAGGDVVPRAAQLPREQREAGNVPVVVGVDDRRLHQDPCQRFTSLRRPPGRAGAGRVRGR